MNIKKRYISGILLVAVIVTPFARAKELELIPSPLLRDRCNFIEGVTAGGPFTVSSDFGHYPTDINNINIMLPRIKMGNMEWLEKIEIVVEELPTEAKTYGLTKETLHTDTELRLRQFGIEVTTMEDPKKSIEEQIRSLSENMKQTVKKQKQMEQIFNLILAWDTYLTLEQITKGSKQPP